MKRQTTASMRRRGATAVEMAIIAPLLLAILFAIIEFGWYFMARQMVHNAATEGVRLAILPGWSAADVETAVRARLLETLGSTASTNAEFLLSPDDSDASPCAAVTIGVLTDEIALPGWILQAAGLAGSGEKIEFKRWMSTQNPDWAPTNPNVPCG